jgi:hypothetical protein
MSAVLKGMRIDALPDLQDEKVALAEAYEIEVARLRRSPERLMSLEPHVRTQLHDATRTLQESMTVNLQALVAARQVVERVLRNIGESLARGSRTPTYGAHGEAAEAEPMGQVISVAFDRRL